MIATAMFDNLSLSLTVLTIVPSSLLILNRVTVYVLSSRTRHNPPRNTNGETTLNTARRPGTERIASRGLNKNPIPSPYFRSDADTKYSGARSSTKPTTASLRSYIATSSCSAQGVILCATAVLARSDIVSAHNSAIPRLPPRSHASLYWSPNACSICSPYSRLNSSGYALSSTP